MTKDTTGGSSNSYYYDDNGNLTKKNDGTDDYVYVYDVENRMTSYDGPGTSNDTDYVYAASSWERIRKTVDGTSTKFLRDGKNVVAEYDGSDTLVAMYVNGLRIDEHLSKTISGRTYYYLVDHLGSVREFIDSSEATQNSYDYSSFGEVVGTPTENVSNVYRFTGRAYDAELGWQYHRHRFYVASLGRWNRKDPIGTDAGPNLYAYTQANPVLYTDIYGEMSIRECRRNVRAVIHRGGELNRLYREARIGGCLRGRPKCKNDCRTSHYNWRTRGITMCCSQFEDDEVVNVNLAGGPALARDDYFKQVLSEELYHAISLCGRPVRTCKDCIIEEVRANRLAGGCDSPSSCFNHAWDSCNIGQNAPCEGEARDRHEGDSAWPPDPLPCPPAKKGKKCQAPEIHTKEYMMRRVID